jgi:hypothetical protein
VCVGLAGAAEDAFRALPAEQYPAQQKQGDVVVAVKPYHEDSDAQEAFGKTKPFKYGVMPVLLIVTNNGGEPLGLENIKVRFLPAGDSRGLEPVPASDLAYHRASTKPKERPPYIPQVPGLGGPKVRKGPLAAEVIGLREFRAPVVGPETSASGFFYYTTGTASDLLHGAAMYISGIRNLSTGQELFYFEIPLGAYE